MYQNLHVFILVIKNEQKYLEVIFFEICDFDVNNFNIHSPIIFWKFNYQALKNNIWREKAFYFLLA